MAKSNWANGWKMLSGYQRSDAAAGELLLTIESFDEDCLVEQFGKESLAGLRVVKRMIAAMQQCASRSS